MSDLIVGMSRLDPVPPIIPDGVSVSGGYVPSDLGRKLKLAIKALNEIADEDYRGNRSPGSVTAYRALQDMGERK